VRDVRRKIQEIAHRLAFDRRFTLHARLLGRSERRRHEGDTAHGDSGRCRHPSLPSAASSSRAAVRVRAVSRHRAAAD
jgi:hypothetical protein